MAASAIHGEIRINHAGCLNQCGHGPMAVMWPENVWYAGVKAEDVVELMGHIKTGRVVERLRYRPLRAGSNKTEAVKTKESEKGSNVD